MDILQVLKANIFGELEGQQMSDAQFANFLAVDIFEREHIEANGADIDFLEKRLRATLHCLNKSICRGEV